jgi:putative peptide zinc metalloprotease protein
VLPRPETSVRDDLPPARDGGVKEEEHRRAAVEAAAKPAPQLAEGIELIGEYAGSGFKEAPYIARRADGQVIQMAKLLYLVAEEIDGQRGYAEIGERVTEKFGRGLDAEMTQIVVEEKLAPLGIVALPGRPAPELKKVDPLLALKFRVAVVPERAVNAITKVFRFLYFPPVVALVLGGLVALDVWLFGYHGVAQSLRAVLYDPLFILLMIGLVIVSAAFHECGHATACSYGGARPGVMGAGIYIVWPAFYTDVTDAYRLGKGGRLRTDLGGVYFNTIFILATAGAYFATGFEPLLLVIPLQHLEILHQFLPFLRLDGYYIVSDLTGVPDMFQRIKPTLKSLIPFTKTEKSVTALKPWARVAVTAYVLTLVPLLLFFLGMMVMNMPRIFATAYDSFMVTQQRLGHGGIAGTIVDVFQLIVLLLVPLGVIATFFQMGRKFGGAAWTATDGRPVARAGLVGVLTAAAGFAAYTWFPESVYHPIQPGEKGTVVGGVDQFGSFSNDPALPPKRLQQLHGAPSKSKQQTQNQQTTNPTQTTKTTTSPSSSTTTPTGTTRTTTSPSSTTPAATPTSSTPTTTSPSATTSTTPTTSTTTTPTTTTTP